MFTLDNEERGGCTFAKVVTNLENVCVLNLPSIKYVKFISTLKILRLFFSHRLVRKTSIFILNFKYNMRILMWYLFLFYFVKSIFKHLNYMQPQPQNSIGLCHRRRNIDLTLWIELLDYASTRYFMKNKIFPSSPVTLSEEIELNCHSLLW